jgi:periplasmic divalent cation tolerance protein
MPVPGPSEPLLVFTTLEDAEQARAFVRRLVDARIAACGTVLPGAASVYRWEGTVTTADEALVLLKTTRARWEALVAAVDRDHPYTVPELLAVPVSAGLPRYLAWVRDATTEVAT